MLLIALVAASCLSQATGTAQEKAYSIAFSNDNNGEIAPCG